MGGHHNHSLFWQVIKPQGGGELSGALAAAIVRDFGSSVAFKSQFAEAAMKRFGSGWAWLCYNPAKKGVAICSTANQDSPYTEGEIPLLGIDVWEHAYYLKYQNKRVDYVKAFFNVIDWDAVAARYADAQKS